MELSVVVVVDPRVVLGRAGHLGIIGASLGIKRAFWDHLSKVFFKSRSKLRFPIDPQLGLPIDPQFDP